MLGNYTLIYVTTTQKNIKKRIVYSRYYIFLPFQFKKYLTDLMIFFNIL